MTGSHESLGGRRPTPPTVVSVVMWLDGRLEVRAPRSTLARFGLADRAVERLDDLATLLPEASMKIVLEVKGELLAGRSVAPRRIELRTRDGAKRAVDLSGFPIRDRDGAVVCGVGVVSNLEYWQRLERSVRLHEHAQRVAGVGSWVYDATVDRLEWSPELYRLCGFSPEVEPSVDGYHEIVHPDDLPRVLEMAERFLREGRAEPHEYRIVRPSDGETRTVYTAARAIDDEQGRRTVFLGTTLDVTGRKAMERRLHGAARLEALERLAGGVAHDFNNLLTVIRGYVQLLGRRVSGEELVQIEAATAAGARLVRQLLAVGRRSAVSTTVLDLRSTIRGASTLVERILGESVQLEVVLDDDLWPVVLDRGLMEQILFNLAANARDAMPDGGRLEIRARNVTEERGEHVEIRCTDSGVGMPPEVLALAFDPMFSTKREPEGTGLGLSTVKGVVEQHGGSVELISEVGVGTTIRFSLPRSSSVAPTPEMHPVAPELTVLVVDDESSIADLMRRILENRGHRVLSTSSARDATASWESAGSEIDVVVADVVMPDLSGPELVSRFRLDRADLPAVFVTGYAADFAEDIRPDDVLVTKPFSVRELVAAVESVGARDRSRERP